MDHIHRLLGRIHRIRRGRLLRRGGILGQFTLPPITRRVTQTRPSAVAVATTLLASRLSTAQQSRPRSHLLQERSTTSWRPRPTPTVARMWTESRNLVGQVLRRLPRRHPSLWRSEAAVLGATNGLLMVTTLTPSSRARTSLPPPQFGVESAHAAAAPLKTLSTETATSQHAKLVISPSKGVLGPHDTCPNCRTRVTEARVGTLESPPLG